MKAPPVFFTLMVISAVLPAAAPPPPLTPEALYHFSEEPAQPDSLILGPDGCLYGVTSQNMNPTVLKRVPVGDPLPGQPQRFAIQPIPIDDGYGSVFKFDPRTRRFQTLTAFKLATGFNPAGLPVLGPDGSLYGATTYGGEHGRGAIYKLSLDGVLTVLHHFDGSLGYGPTPVVVNAAGDVFGTLVTSPLGSSSGTHGCVYKLSASGAITKLYGFPEDFDSFPGPLTLGSDGGLYGSTYNGNTQLGHAFQVAPDGSCTLLADLKGLWMPYLTGLRQGPQGFLYGTTASATTGAGLELGSFSYPIASWSLFYKVSPQGVKTKLFEFTRETGFNPAGRLTLGADGKFYGTAIHGGPGEAGTVFRISPQGGFELLADFMTVDTSTGSSRPLGCYPYGGVCFGADGNLYGTTASGGKHGSGTIFRVRLNPKTGDDIASADDDKDGVPDERDKYPNTAAKAVVNKDGASIEQLAPRLAHWRNHTSYVASVTRVANSFRSAGLIDAKQSSLIIQTAARSKVGKR